MTFIPRQLQEHVSRLPLPVQKGVAHGLSIAAGLLIALILHYLFYRIGLPSKPFIYVSF